VTERSDAFSEAVVQRLAMAAGDVDCSTAHAGGRLFAAHSQRSRATTWVVVHHQLAAVTPLSGKSIER
jgi:hypothetical protein